MFFGLDNVIKILKASSVDKYRSHVNVSEGKGRRRLNKNNFA